MEWIRRLIGTPTSTVARGRKEARAPATNVPTIYTRYIFSEPHRRVAAIGDLHGRIDLLDTLGLQLDALAGDKDRRLLEIYLGDYVDRGGNARAVLDFLTDRIGKADRDVVCLQGNHEQLLLAGLESDRDFMSWLRMGGESTLHSYGLSPRSAKSDPTAARLAFREALPPAHLDFLRSLPPFFECGGFFFVHAGVRPGRPLGRQRVADLLWIREGFITSTADFGAIVVHGHTPTSKPQFRANRIGIDTGAYYSGTLTCLLVTNENVSVLAPPKRLETALLLPGA